MVRFLPLQVLTSPSDYGKDVYLFDGLRKDENDVEFYFKEFCYKSVNIDSHDEKGSSPSFPHTFFAHSHLTRSQSTPPTSSKSAMTARTTTSTTSVTVRPSLFFSFSLC
jgi:hypothetical protein